MKVILPKSKLIELDQDNYNIKWFDIPNREAILSRFEEESDLRDEIEDLKDKVYNLQREVYDLQDELKNPEGIGIKRYYTRII